MILTLALATACGPKGPAGWPSRDGAGLRAMASMDLACPVEQLAQQKVDHYIHKVEGCGRSQVYLFHLGKDRWEKYGQSAAVAGPPSPTERPAPHVMPTDPGEPRISINFDPAGEGVTIKDESGQITSWFKPLLPCSKSHCNVALFEQCPDFPRLIIIPHSQATSVLQHRRACSITPTQTLRLIEGGDAESVRDRLRADACCAICVDGKPCGDSCISHDLECHNEAGCAC